MMDEEENEQQGRDVPRPNTDVLSQQTFNLRFKCPFPECLHWTKRRLNNAVRHSRTEHSIYTTCAEVYATWEQAPLPPRNANRWLVNEGSGLVIGNNRHHEVPPADAGDDVEPIIPDHGFENDVDIISEHNENNMRAHLLPEEAGAHEEEEPVRQNIADPDVPYTTADISTLCDEIAGKLSPDIMNILRSFAIPLNTTHEQILSPFPHNKPRGFRTKDSWAPFPNYTIVVFFILKYVVMLSNENVRLVMELVRHPEFSPNDVPKDLKHIKEEIVACMPTLHIDAQVTKEKCKSSSVSQLEVMACRCLANPIISKALKYNPVYLYQDGVNALDDAMNKGNIYEHRVYGESNTADKWHMNERLTQTVAVYNRGPEGIIHICRGDYVLLYKRQPNVRDDGQVSCMLVHHIATVRYVNSPEDEAGIRVIVGYHLKPPAHVRHNKNATTYTYTAFDKDAINMNKVDNLRMVPHYFYEGHMEIDGHFAVTNKFRNIVRSFYLVQPPDSVPIRRCGTTIQRPLSMETFRDGSCVHTFVFRGVTAHMVRLSNSPFHHIMCPVANYITSICIEQEGKRGANPMAVFMDMKTLHDNLSLCENKQKWIMLYNETDKELSCYNMFTGSMIGDIPELTEVSQSLKGQVPDMRRYGEYKMMGLDLVSEGVPLDAPDDLYVRKTLVNEMILYNMKRGTVRRPNNPDLTQNRQYAQSVIKQNPLPNPFMEGDVDIFPALTFAIKHESYSNFANCRVISVIINDVLSVNGRKVIAQKYSKYANADPLYGCIICEHRSQLISQRGRVKFHSVELFLNVFHLVMCDMFHPTNLYKWDEFTSMFSQMICKQFTEDDYAARAAFQTRLIKLSQLTTEICQMANKSSVREEDFASFRALTEQINTLASELDGVITEVTVPQRLPENEADAQNEVMEAADGVVVEDDDAVVDDVDDAPEEIRGAVPNSGLLKTIAVTIFFLTWVQRVRENGSFAYHHEVAGEHRQGHVKKIAKNTSSQEDSMHEEMMMTEEQISTFVSLLCGTPYVYTKAAVFQPSAFDGDKQKAAMTRVSYFTACAALGQLQYPGGKLQALSCTDKVEKKYNLSENLRCLLQDMVSHSLFYPIDKLTVYSAARAGNHNVLLVVSFTEMCKKLADIAYLTDAVINDDEWMTNMKNSIKKQCTVGLQSAKADIDNGVDCLAFWKTITGWNLDNSPGDGCFVMVKFGDVGLDARDHEIGPHCTSVSKVSLAQVIGCVGYSCQKNATHVPEEQIGVVICWFEDQNDTDRVYKYQKYKRGLWDVVPLQSVMRLAHVIPDQMIGNAFGRNTRFHLNKVLLNPYAHYKTLNT